MKQTFIASITILEVSFPKAETTPTDLCTVFFGATLQHIALQWMHYGWRIIYFTVTQVVQYQATFFTLTVKAYDNTFL